VDLLVEMEAPVTFDRYIDVKFYLEDLSAKPVDLVTALSLKPQLRATVEREAIRSRNLRLYLEYITVSCDKILRCTSGISLE
jgi:hypothetical protein